VCYVQPVLSSSNELVFLSPSVNPVDGPTSSSRLPVRYNISFIMDGVRSLRRTFAVFSLLPNPTLLPFKDDRKEYRGEILSLEVSCWAIFLSRSPMLERDVGISGVSVCLSVTRWLKTKNRRIIRFSPMCSPGTLVFSRPTFILQVAGTPNYNPGNPRLEKPHVIMRPCHPLLLRRGSRALFLAMTHARGLQIRCRWCWARSVSVS